MRIPGPADPAITYAEVLDILPVVAYTAGADGLLTYVSPAWQTLTGHPAARLLGIAYLDIVHPDDAPRAFGRWEAARAERRSYRDELRLRYADGSYRWVLSRAEPLRDEAAEVVGWFGTVVDIDERVRGDESREQFVRMADKSDDFVCICDNDGNLQYVNASGRAMLAIASIEEALATKAIDYFVPEDRALVRSTVLAALASTGHWLGELRMRNFRTNAPVPISYNVFTLLDAAGVRVGVATVSRDLRDRNRVEAGLRALAETGAAMYGSLDFQTTLRNVADAVARSFATYCCLDVVDDDGRIRSVAAAQRSPEAVPLIERAAAARNLHLEHPVARAIYYGESSLIAYPDDWMDAMGIRAAVGDAIDALDLASAIYVPLRSVGSGGVYGALTCARSASDPRGAYAKDDIRFAEEIAARAGTAFDNARAYGRQQRIAVALQEASLPKGLPALPGISLSADYRPGNDDATIGGDWYDAFILADGRLAITVGDVMGKGLDAAVTMGKLRQAMRSAASLVPTPNAMLDVADHTLRAESAESYATALAAIYDPIARTCTYASAGHPGPLLARTDGGIEAFSASSTLLGLRTSGESAGTTIALEPGATLVFFTDGLVESTHDIGEGYERLGAAIVDRACLRGSAPARAIVERVLDGKVATDDIAILVMCVGADVATIAAGGHGA